MINNIAVIGAGRSGIGAVYLALKRKIKEIYLCDDKIININNFDITIKKAILDKQVKILSEFNVNDIKNVDEIIVSPGIYIDHPVFKLKDKIKTELEFAMENSNFPVIVITGSNGKTTTTKICGELVRSFFKKVCIAGNIGKSCSKAFADIEYKPDVVVLEVSTFQLENYENIHSDIAVITNISPNHLDRHKTFEEYKRLKLLVGKNQNENDYIIGKLEDDIISEFNSDKLYISSKFSEKCLCCVKNGKIVINNKNNIIQICEVKDLLIVGDHNIENICCAISALWALFKKNNIVFSEDHALIIKDILINFRSVEHRIEFVKEKNGISFYNDSKATTAESVIVALNCFKNNIILIVGGKDKGVDFDILAKSCSKKVKKSIVTGYSADKIAKALNKYNCNYEIIDDFDEAVKKAYNSAEKGDTVILSPACTSYDHFKSYEERGRHFKDIVKNL